ncbi:MAG: MASE1 domain-containing protein [Microbacterium sp.]|uniref:sensor histidine kinase n=1 Tax=Microbacterium sp. TaxID=51671 RepID=UPI001AC73341|nr:ATP-binding protein [Microbacterium sp.]MBN9177766.1 MASE1 domain-containing protein [Microbacterium sp.]
MRAPTADPAASRSRITSPAPSRGRTVALWCAAGVGIFALALAATRFTVPGLPLAVWWPAAGLSAVLALRAPARHRPLAILVIFAANALGMLAGGRAVASTLVLAAADSIEIVVLCVLVLHRRRSAVLRTTADSVRFAVSAAVAAVAYGLMAGVIGIVSAGASPVPIVLITAASHFSAIMLIAPLALLAVRDRPVSRGADPPRRTGTPPRGAFPRRTELTVQIVAALLAVVAGFGPLLPLPLAFLIFLPLIWAALRFPPLVAHIEALAIAVLLVAFSTRGFGAFTTAGLEGTDLGITLTLFLSAIAIFTVTTVTEHNEALALGRVALEAAEQRAEAARATTSTLQVRYDLERQREAFLSTTSHELRTPVTIISGYADLLGERDLPDDAAGWVDAIRRNTDRLAAMLDDLLAARSTHEPQPVSVAAAALAASVVTAYAAASAVRGVTVTVDVAHVALHADRADAERALRHLVSNAVKFVATGGRVEVTAEQSGDDVLITIADDGPGLPESELDQAFDPFFRGARAEADALPGTGIGLTIARMLARRNGGDVRIESTAGRGTRAILRLPSAHTAAELAPEQPVDTTADAAAVTASITEPGGEAR